MAENRQELKRMISAHGLRPTDRRMQIGKAVFHDLPWHSGSTTDVIGALRQTGRDVPPSTVRKTLKSFVERGLLRRFRIGSGYRYFDPMVKRENRIEDRDTGRTWQVDPSQIVFSMFPELPAGTVAEGIMVTIQLRAS